MTKYLFLNKKFFYYSIFQLIFCSFSLILTSLGAFFHFLLDHEISIVESWLHNNSWEIIIFSKSSAFLILYKWFDIQLYQLKSFFINLKLKLKRPDKKSSVISVFLFLGYLTLARVEINGQNFSYFYNHLVSFFGIFVFYILEFLILSLLFDIYGQENTKSPLMFNIFIGLVFYLAFKVSIPDYYKLMPHVIACFGTVIVLSGADFKNGSNVLVFLSVFVAPMGSLFGLDPIWGGDFSAFKLANKLNLSFLLVIWVVSFIYYKYRDIWVVYSRKFIR